LAIGALIIANNSIADTGEVLDYIDLARVNAQLIKKNLNIPTSLVTYDDVQYPEFDKHIVIPRKPAHTRTMQHGTDTMSYRWHNDSRVECFDLSPYERTMLVDADFLILDDLAAPYIRQDIPFVCPAGVYDVTGRESFNAMSHMPDKTIPQLWATMMVWDKRAKDVFDYARNVRDNYQYYATLFGFEEKPIRNDYIFSISAHILGIQGSNFKLPTLPVDSTIYGFNRGLVQIRFPLALPNGQMLPHSTYWQASLHVLNKQLVTTSSLRSNLRILTGSKWN
jgi:hypothetical protein